MPIKHLKRIVLQKFRTFCKNSTLHGFYYFSEKQRVWVYTVWSLIIVSGITLSGVLCEMIWQKFVMDPTFTVVESSHYSTTKIPFPAVSVCDSETVYGPSTANVTHILISRGYDLLQIEEFFKTFFSVKTKEFTPDPDVKKIHLLLHDLGYTYGLLMKMLQKPCNVLLVTCVWRSRVHNCSEMFREVYSHVGYCCQFDMAYFRENANDNVTFVAGVETTEALEIIINGKKFAPNGTITEGYVSLFVYDDQNSVSLVDNAIHLTPAGFFDVNVFVWIIDSSKDTQSLSVKERKCLLPSDQFFGPSFYQGCLSMLVLKRVVNYCRCLPFNYSSMELGLDTYSPCTWERMACIYQTIGDIQGDVRDSVSQKECLQQCDYVQYDTQIDYVRRRRFYRNVNESFSRVSVHFSSNTCIKYRRQVLYTWDQLLANVGGIFGLCLGGSIISIFELLWFFLDLLFTILTTLTKNRTSPKKKSKLVFTLSQKDLITPGIKKKMYHGNDIRTRFVH